MKPTSLFILAILMFVCSPAWSQWVQTAGPTGALLTGVAADSEGNVYAAGGYGCFRSANDGQSWQVIPTTALQWTALRFCVVAGNIVLAGTSHGVFRSSDAGASWTQVNTGLADTNISFIDLAGGKVFAGTGPSSSSSPGGTLHLSTDSGLSWIQCAPFWKDRTIRGVAAGAGATIVVGLASNSSIEGGSINRSTDGGMNWDAVFTLGSDTSISTLVCGLDGCLFAGTTSFWGGSGSGVLRSTDNGNTWTWQRTGLPAQAIASFVFKSPDHILVSTFGVYSSSDNGNTWQESSDGLTSYTVLQLAAGRDERVYAATYDGIAISTDGGSTWLRSNSGMVGTRVQALLSPSEDTVFAGTFRSGIFRSTDMASSWGDPLSDFTPDRWKTSVVNCLDIDPGGILFAGTRDGIFRSTNSGADWIEASGGLTNTNISALLIDSNRVLLGTYGDGVFMSTDSGNGWSSTSVGLANMYVNALAISGTNILAGTNDGIYVSSDKGSNWASGNLGIPQYTRVYAFAVSGTDLFAATWSGIGAPVYVSTDKGASWTAMSAGLSNSVNCFAVSKGNVFAGTSLGVYLLGKGSGSWMNVSDGLSDPQVNALAVNGANLVAGTGAGVWRRPLPEMVSVHQRSVGTPHGYSLSQNYPNPFNPKTVVSFQLSVVSKVKISVFDILGREIAVLVNEQKLPGSYSVEFDGDGLSSGIYFYRLQAGSFVETKEMLLLR